MMDTLQILIEADATGLTSSLKKAGDDIMSFIDQMNSQTVNWETILSGTISPAIISGIAATFAMAITSAVGFQNAMVQTANTSTDSFGQNSAAAAAAAQSIQASTGQSSDSVVSAMGIAIKILGNYSGSFADATALVQESSAMALTTGLPLLDIVNQMAPAIKAWGITGADKITTTIQDLFGAAHQGSVGLGDLTAALASTGTELKGNESIQDASASLEALSNQAGVKVPDALDLFKLTAAADFGDVTAKAALTVIGVDNVRDSITKVGMGGTLADIEKHFDNMSASTAVIFGNHAGFSTETVADLKTASQYYSTLADDSKTIRDNEEPMGKEIQDNLSLVNKLQVAWGTIKTDLTSIGNTALPIIVGILQGIIDPSSVLPKVLDAVSHSGPTINGAIKSVTSGSIMDTLENIFKTVVLENPLSGDMLEAMALTNTPAAASTPAGSTANTSNVTNNYNISPKAVGGSQGSALSSIEASMYKSFVGI